MFCSGQIETYNVVTGEKETIGSWNERFSYTDEDIEAYLSFAKKEGYQHIILGGHSKMLEEKKYL